MRGNGFSGREVIQKQHDEIKEKSGHAIPLAKENYVNGITPGHHFGTWGYFAKPALGG